jgi:hypothetical protein
MTPAPAAESIVRRPAAYGRPAGSAGSGHQQLPLDPRHPEHQERHEHNGDDDQADEDHGPLPSGDPGVASRRRRPIPSGCPKSTWELKN